MHLHVPVRSIFQATQWSGRVVSVLASLVHAEVQFCVKNGKKTAGVITNAARIHLLPQTY